MPGTRDVLIVPVLLLDVGDCDVLQEEFGLACFEAGKPLLSLIGVLAGGYQIEKCKGARTEVGCNFEWVVLPKDG